MKPAAVLAIAQSSAQDGHLAGSMSSLERLAQPKHRLPAFVAGLLAWQIALLLALLSDVIGGGIYLTIHVFGCAGAASWLLWGARNIPLAERHAALQALGWSALAGPFGAFVAAAFVRTAASHHAEAVDDEAAMPATPGCEMTGAEVMQVRLLDRRMRLEGARQVRPLMTIIAEGTQAQKLEALGIVYRQYDALLSAVLKQALRDPDASVRVLAATVMSRLHANYAREIGDCQNATAAAPEVAQHWRDTAEARLAYAESGLLDAARARAEVEFAVAALSRAVAIAPDDQESRIRLERARRQLTASST